MTSGQFIFHPRASRGTSSCAFGATHISKAALLPLTNLHRMMTIKMPKAIDDHNHWMNGVDKADQLIACHWPNLQ